MNAPATPRELASRAVARPEDLVGYELIRTLVGFPTRRAATRTSR